MCISLRGRHPPPAEGGNKHWKTAQPSNPPHLSILAQVGVRGDPAAEGVGRVKLSPRATL